MFPGNGQFLIQAAVPQQQQTPGQINVTSIPQQATIVQNRQVPTVVQTSQVIKQIITTNHLVLTTGVKIEVKNCLLFFTPIITK